MPGYRALSSSFVGSAADSAREAESLRRDGDSVTAITLLEEALEASQRSAPQLPGWLCGRLAALYRTVGRYDDEVALLERYRESQTSEEARSRYDARLSKARTIAERKRRSDSGALVSVRKVLGNPRRRGTSAGGAASAPATTNEFERACLQVLSVPPGEPEAEFEARLDAMMIPQCAAARAAGVPVERLVQSLKNASQAAASLPVATGEREGRYSTALLRLLSAYFEDADR